ncbi:F-box/kelch-repeat protein [Raphanus sativus]|uniref:F-box/kelch-repeat protein At2g44700-like n=1 Tax=Raphanus sativus TaxID=3726 RepID=A0A6J0JTR2_RAPSA|nr:F-box/kelch-repeat protein At2g44700-like [Raphanus sativus]KAJ4890824.1 F-box/kelch-repeat protein [Raphanus sativus]
MSPSSFSSLPIDIVLEIFARVPKRSHPILSCVSKNFNRLLRSPAEIHKIRSLLRKDSLFICFVEKTDAQWFTLRRAENNPTENHFSSIDLVFPSHTKQEPCVVVAIGPELFFGSFHPSSTMWVLDSRTLTFRQGPSSRGDRLCRSACVVGSKVYVIGIYTSDDEINVESFDVKTQTWELADVPDDQGWWWSAVAIASLNRKVCAFNFSDNARLKCYDPRDGSCESLGLPTEGKLLCRTGACVMNNVLYVYYARLGLMWFDSEMRLWRVVSGLSHLNKVRSVAMAEYYGKMAFLWEDEIGVVGETKEVWCRMIALERREGEVRGIAEAPQLLGSVPRGYRLQHCLSVSD